MNLLKNNIVSLLRTHLIAYPVAVATSYLWSTGSLIGCFVSIQICTGLLLAPHYIPEAEYAFASVEHIMREVNYGWLFRYAHSNGASFIFALLYIHLARGLFYRSYLVNRGEAVWYSGMSTFVLMMVISFIGYVLPWGQMSFWAAVVITNLVTVLPNIGPESALWLWGGPSVANPTLMRLYTLHFFLPFLLVVFILWHLTAVHLAGSTNPLYVAGHTDIIKFFPYFYVKDLFAFCCVFFLFVLVVFFFPDALGHPDNYIPANVFITPKHIVPEWYFLPFFAILRAIPNKVFGILAMFSSIAIIFILPKLDVTCHATSPVFKPLFEFMFSIFLVSFLLLGFAGTKAPIYPYLQLSQVCTFFYFFSCLFCFCFLSRLELYFFNNQYSFEKRRLSFKEWSKNLLKKKR